MGWRILVNVIRQSMLKLKTHSGFQDLLEGRDVRIVIIRRKQWYPTDVCPRCQEKFAK
jgi:hypothetical protein